MLQQQFAVRVETGDRPIMVSVPLANNSRARDRLVGLKSSCSCVTTAELPRELLAGEAWDLPLRIDSSRYSPGDKYVFELTLFLESGSAVPVQINFEMAEDQPPSSVGFEEKGL